MKRRWKWPIFDVVKALDGDNWLMVCVVWLFGGFILVVIPVMAITSDKHGDIQMVPVLFWTLLGWGIPVLIPLLVGIAVLLFKLGTMFVPHRATEPVREDLRSYYR